jgi:hypothetical protein
MQGECFYVVSLGEVADGLLLGVRWRAGARWRSKWAFGGL